MKIHQLDITTTYLNGKLEEEIFMEPSDFIIKALETLIERERRNTEIRNKAIAMLKEFKTGDKVCLLKRSLYGFRQAGRNWHTKLSEVLKKLGATPSDADTCTYRIGRGMNATFIAVYVDDMILVSRNMDSINKLKKNLALEFNIRDLGEIKHCLAI